jgi:hypothetical protein
MSRICTCVVLSLVLAPTQFLSATVIYDNGVVLKPDMTQDEWNAGNSDDIVNTRLADDFNLQERTTLKGIQWSGLYWPLGPGDPSTPLVEDDFTIQLYRFIGDTPATVPFRSFAIGNSAIRTDTGLKDSFGYGLPIFTYDATIPENELAPGRYLISIFDDSTGSPVPVKFGWTYGFTDDESNSAYYRIGVGGQWEDQGDLEAEVLDFKINGELVPEPGTLALLLAGGAILSCWQRRCFKAQ